MERGREGGSRLRPFVTGSRATDLLLFALLLALILGLTDRLRVYHNVPGWAIERATQTPAADPTP